MGDDIETIKYLERQLTNNAEKVGLTVNDDKTECIILLDEETEMADYKNTLSWKDVVSKEYQSLNIWDRLWRRIMTLQLANNGYYGLEKVLKSWTFLKN